MVLFCSNHLNAQTGAPFKAYEKKENIGQGLNDAICVYVPHIDQKTLNNLWKEKMKSFQAKVKGRAQTTSTGVLMPDLSAQPITIYSSSRSLGHEASSLIVGFKLETGFINSTDHPNAFQEAKKFVEDFSLNASKSSVSSNIKDQLNKLEKKQRELQAIEKKRVNRLNDLERYQQLILKAQTDTTNLRIQLAEKKIEIEAQQALLKALEEKKNSIRP